MPLLGYVPGGAPNHPEASAHRLPVYLAMPLPGYVSRGAPGRPRARRPAPVCPCHSHRAMVRKQGAGYQGHAMPCRGMLCHEGGMRGAMGPSLGFRAPRTSSLSPLSAALAALPPPSLPLQRCSCPPHPGSSCQLVRRSAAPSHPEGPRPPRCGQSLLCGFEGPQRRQGASSRCSWGRWRALCGTRAP